MPAMARSASAASTPVTPPSQVYTVAVLLGLFSLLTILLVLPPLFWHLRNRNIGATSLVAWIITLLFFTFINAIIWPSDNMSTWFSGIGLCDVEVKIQVASQVALPSSFAAVLRGLAAVLNTDRATLVQTKAQRRRNYAIDLLFCVAAPLLQMGCHEIVHFRRFAVFGIAGCTPVVHDSWLTLLLLSVPPLLWTVTDVVYAIIILVRLYRYRLTFNSILASSNTSKSRFLRLYIICLVWICVFLPISVFLLVKNSGLAATPYSWSQTHDRAAYTEIFKVPSNGAVLLDRWIWLASGALVFVFFGLGREAVGMYRTASLAMGMGRIFPALHREPRRPTISTISSFSSKAKMLFTRKSSTASDAPWASASSTVRSLSHASNEPPVSPKTATAFLEAIREVSPERDGEKAAPAPPHEPPFCRLTSLLSRAAFPSRERGSANLPLAELANQDATVRSTVSAGPRPGSLMTQQGRDWRREVVVRKEVRQGSEHEKA